MTTSKLHGIKLTLIRAIMFALFALGATVALADDPKYGGVSFDCDMMIDGKLVAANTPVYATEWPMQFCCRPVLAEGETLYGFYHEVAPTDNLPNYIYPALNGDLYVIPPSATGVVTVFKRRLATLVVWVDANEGSDTDGNGTEENPYATLQKGASCNKNTSTYLVVKAKKGVYKTEGAFGGDMNNRVLITNYTLLQAVEGPDETVIEGFADTKTYPEYQPENKLPGTGPNAVRCLYFNNDYDSAVQGFTIREGHTDKTASNWWDDQSKGGAMFAKGYKNMLVDCVISNCTGGLGVLYNGTTMRCRFSGCTAVNITYSAQNFSTVFCGNRVAGVGVGGNWLACRNVQCTVADDRTLQTGPFYDCVLRSSAWWPSSVPYYGSVGGKGAGSSYPGYAYGGTVLVDADNGDLRLRASGTAVGGATLPEPGSDAWTAWELAFREAVHGDVNGNPIRFANGRPVAGAVQELAYLVRVTPDYGALAVEGGVAGDNYLAPGQTVVVTANPDAQVHAKGVMVGADTYLFADIGGSYSFTVPAEGLAEGVTINPLYVSTQAISIPTTGSARLTVTGGIEGENIVGEGCTITLEPNTNGTRFADGIVVNGTTYLFEDLPGGKWSYTVPMGGSDTPLVITTIVSTKWYVAKDGNDSNKGIWTNCAFKTFAKALTKSGSGHTVRVMPGIYADDQEPVKLTFTAPWTGDTYTRLSVPYGVTFESTEGPEKTVIKGAPASADQRTHELGLGTNAVRCVYLAGNGAKIRGFTLTGGYTRTDTDSVSAIYVDGGLGGGVFGNRGVDHNNCTAEDCIISNNYSRHGTVRSVGLVNCRIVDNFALSCPGGYSVDLVGCFADGNWSTGDSTSFMNVYRLANTTLGYAWKKSGAEPEECNVYEQPAYDYPLVNSVILGKVGWITVESFLGAENCAFVKGRLGYLPTAKFTNCIVTNVEAFALNSCGMPAVGSLLVDAGKPDGVLATLSKDVYGGQRVYNGKVDIGAVEYDWRGDYAKDIAKREVVVSAADPQVIEREGKVTLDPGASLIAEWTPVGESARCDVKASVTGTGTLTVSVDGVAIRTVTAADSPKTFNFVGAIGKTSKILFSYSQEEGDEGCAVIEKVGSQQGLLLLVR